MGQIRHASEFGRFRPAQIAGGPNSWYSRGFAVALYHWEAFPFFRDIAHTLLRLAWLSEEQTRLLPISITGYYCNVKKKIEIFLIFLRPADPHLIIAKRYHILRRVVISSPGRRAK